MNISKASKLFEVCYFIEDKEFKIWPDLVISEIELLISTSSIQFVTSTILWFADVSKWIADIINHWIRDINKWIADINKWISDINNSIADINNLIADIYLQIHFYYGKWRSTHLHGIMGCPSCEIWRQLTVSSVWVFLFYKSPISPEMGSPCAWDRNHGLFCVPTLPVCSARLIYIGFLNEACTRDVGYITSQSRQ